MSDAAAVHSEAIVIDDFRHPKSSQLGVPAIKCLSVRKEQSILWLEPCGDIGRPTSKISFKVVDRHVEDRDVGFARVVRHMG